MGLIRDLSKAQLAFQLAGGDVGTWQVIRYRGTEGLCQLYRFEIELTTLGEQIALDDAVGKPARLSVNTDHGERRFNGIVSRFEMTGEASGQQHFRAELVPAVWQLTHRYNSRIFQNKTVIEIISAVMEAAGVLSDRYDLSLLQGTYPQREYCVQYRETDYNFIARLMEEAGIWWFFQQTETADVMRLADSRPAYEPIDAESAALPYKPLTGMSAPDEHVFRFRLGQSVRPGAVALNDFNFKNPQLDLMATGDLGRDAELEFYDYPGEYDKQALGTSLAKIRTEEFETRRVVGSGQSNSPRLAPGREFGLTGHPTAPLNDRYLITAVTYEGKQAVLRTSNTNGQSGSLNPRTRQALLAARRSEDAQIRDLAEGILQVSARVQRGDPTARRELTDWLYHAGQISRDAGATAAALGGSPLEALSIPNLVEDVARSSLVDLDAPVYECRFECIPADVTYRPPRITPWPVMRGTQTARVSGRTGEEIDTDAYGRVKVQFNWDREGKFDEFSSCWIRVSQGWAGGQFGMMFLPRIGQEVIVDFLEGDPDKPIITGRVYNADHMPPYKLPEEKTKSTIKTLSSPADKRYHEIRFEDRLKREQLFIRAQRRMDTRVAGTHYHTSGSLHQLVGRTKDGEQKGRFFRTVHEGNELRTPGNQFEQIEKLRHVVVGQDAIDALLQNYSQFVKGNAEIKVDGRIVIASEQEVSFYVGNNFIRITPQGIQLHGNSIKLNCSDATPPAGIDGKEVQLPLDARPADDGKPGKRRRGGGGGGGSRSSRTRKKLFLEGLPGPVVKPPKKKDPPRVRDGLSIMATCEHGVQLVHGGRSVREGGTLEVDRIRLTAKRPAGVVEPAIWNVTRVGELVGDVRSFNAVPNDVRGKWKKWFPEQRPRKYHVTCRAGSEPSKSLQVHAYRRRASRERIHLEEVRIVQYLKRITDKIDDVLDFVGKSNWTLNNDDRSLEAEAGWREYSDHRAYFFYRINAQFDPLIEGGFRLPLKAKKILAIFSKRIARAAGKLFDPEVFIDVGGKISADLTAARTSPDQKLYGRLGGKVTGKLDLSLGAGASTLGDLLAIEGKGTGDFKATGAPFIDQTGFGADVKLEFTGLKGSLKVKYGWGTKTYKKRIYKANKNFYSDRVYFHRSA